MQTDRKLEFIAGRSDRASARFSQRVTKAIVSLGVRGLPKPNVLPCGTNGDT